MKVLSAHISPVSEDFPSQPILTILDTFGDTDLIKSAKFQIGQLRDFCFYGFLKMACFLRKVKSSITLGLALPHLYVMRIGS